MDDDNHKKNENQENVSNQSGKSIIKYLESEDKSYYVLDTPNEEDIKKLERLDYLFILESPHTDEVIKEHPLAGDSGKAVTKFLFGDKTSIPFGKLVKLNSDLLEFKHIAIMNVSNVPLQTVKGYNDDYASLADYLEALRDPKANEETAGFDCLLKLFEDSLKNILKACERIKRKPHIFVCGQMAVNYFEKASQKKSSSKANKNG